MRVVDFSREECPFSNRDHTWQQFHSFRNQVLDLLVSYGTVGPSGKMPILDSYEESANEWQVGSKRPDFFVVDDDMYGMSVRVETTCGFMKPVILECLAMLLKQFGEWCVYLAIVKGGVWVFHDRILLEGSFFDGCRSVADFYHRCALAGEATIA